MTNRVPKQPTIFRGAASWDSRTRPQHIPVRKSQSPLKQQHSPVRKTASQSSIRRTAPRLRLGPNDPQALGVGTAAILPGPNGSGNVQITDEAYTLAQEDRLVIVAVNAATLTLCPEPLSGFPVTIVADGGVTTVKGPIQGGTQTIPQGLVGVFVFSPESEEWSVNIGVSGSSSTSWPFQTITGNTTVTKENTLATVTANGAIVTIGSGLMTITIKDKTGSLTPTIGVESQSGATLEDPNNLGTYAADVFLKTANGAVQFRFNGTSYEVVSST